MPYPIDHPLLDILPGDTPWDKPRLGENARFAYYTSSEVAISVIRNGQLWMRNATVMNDYREMQHGIDLIIRHMNVNSALGGRFWDAIGQISADLRGRLITAFDENIPNIANETYLTCISKHSEEEREFGRLSMWRAYGGAGGVAIILNTEVFSKATDALGVFSLPVRYFTDSEATSHFNELALAIYSSVEDLKSHDEDTVFDFFHALFVDYCIVLKHPGFREEKEWRIFHQPNDKYTHPPLAQVEVINGIAQKVHKINLENTCDIGVPSMDKRELIDHILIGPCQYPWAMYQAFVKELGDAGFTNPEVRVKTSNIPLRT